jgi:hypothetical protein
MKGVCLLIVLMQYICTGTKTKGTIIKSSSSRPGVNITPHYKSSYFDIRLIIKTYLYSKSIKISQDSSEQGRDDESYHMKEANHFLEFVDRILDNLLNQHCEPECIKLGHIVEKGC